MLTYAHPAAIWLTRLKPRPPLAMIRERSRTRTPRPINVFQRPPRPPPPRMQQPPSIRRRVLLLVDLDPTRELFTSRGNDAMQVTTRDFDNNVDHYEQTRIFQFSRLLNVRQVRHTTVEDILHGIVNYMFSTWGIIISINSIDLRWTDRTGDVFALRNASTISSLLMDHRPDWQTAQESIIFHTLQPFNGPASPYVMRMIMPQGTSRSQLFTIIPDYANLHKKVRILPHCWFYKYVIPQ